MDFLQEFVEFFWRNLEGFFLDLDLSFNDRRVVVVLRGAVDKADDVKLLVVAELLASESGVRQLNTVKGTVLAVGDFNKNRPTLGFQTDEDLIGQLGSVQVPQLIKKTGASPAATATAIAIATAIDVIHPIGSGHSH